MEYIFKNTVSQKPQTIILSGFSMNVQSAASEKTVSYASILSVRLTKSNGFFKTIVAIDGERPIEITNRFYRPDGSFEDRSHQYETFIRVLHFHLKEKSSAQILMTMKSSVLMVSTSCLLHQMCTAKKSPTSTTTITRM
ncbi:MAG: hypothetical protein ACKVOQ_21415 [Cyclobacteriaceae bacterium]